MIALIQRVSQAAVTVDAQTVSSIGAGLLVLLGVQKGDNEALAEKLAQRILNYRVFADADGKMNLDVQQINGEVLVVSQFTLVADTRKGRRPSFSSAAEPAVGEALYQHFVRTVQESLGAVKCGRFGADMQVSLVNDGPVTFSLQESPLERA